MANLATIGLSGGTLRLSGTVGDRTTFLPAIGDTVIVGTETFVFHTNAASASAYEYVYTGTTIDQCVTYLNLAINSANRSYFRRAPDQLLWPKTDPAFASDIHFGGGIIVTPDALPVTNNIATSSGSVSGSVTTTVADLSKTQGF